ADRIAELARKQVLHHGLAVTGLAPGSPVPSTEVIKDEVNIPFESLVVDRGCTQHERNSYLAYAVKEDGPSSTRTSSSRGVGIKRPQHASTGWGHKWVSPSQEASVVE